MIQYQRMKKLFGFITGINRTLDFSSHCPRVQKIFQFGSGGPKTRSQQFLSNTHAGRTGHPMQRYSGRRAFLHQQSKTGLGFLETSHQMTRRKGGDAGRTNPILWLIKEMSISHTY
jgi:hypothetical protein